MLDIINQFRANIERVKSLGGLYLAMDSLTSPIVDASDLLRAQIVLTVSALDHYIHELTRLGMLEVFDGERPPTDAFLRFQVTMDPVINGAIGTSGNTWFESVIRKKHGYLAFQQPDNIADAVRLFSSISLWAMVAVQLGMSAEDIKTNLKLIVERRNKIAHEADIDPSYPGVRWPINPTDTEKTVDFTSRLCEAIHIVVS